SPTIRTACARCCRRVTCRCQRRSKTDQRGVPWPRFRGPCILCPLGCDGAAISKDSPMSDHVYKSLELTGSSTVGIEDAVNKAIAKASETVRNIQWFNVVETRGHVVNGKVAHWQVTVKVGFTLE